MKYVVVIAALVLFLTLSFWGPVEQIVSPPKFPVTLSVPMETRGRVVTFSLRAVDAEGEVYSTPPDPDGGRLAAPAVRVTDEAGRDVYTFKFRYG
jgi:hypothetical protein